MLLFFSLLLVSTFIATAFKPMFSNTAMRATRSLLRRCATQRSHQQLWSHPSIAHRYTVSALYKTTPGTADIGAASDFTKIEISGMLEDAARYSYDSDNPTVLLR